MIKFFSNYLMQVHTQNLNMRPLIKLEQPHTNWYILLVVENKLN